MERILLRVVVGAAGLIFLVSMLNPFVSNVVWPPFGFSGSPGAATGKFWSFKGALEIVRLIGPWRDLNFSVSTEERWFADYWGLNGTATNPDYSWTWSLIQVGGFGMVVLTFVFAAQILTIGLAMCVLLLRRFVLPLLLGAVVSAFATVFGMGAFSKGVPQFLKFELGFVLAILSGLLFLAALAIYLGSLLMVRKRAV